MNKKLILLVFIWVSKSLFGQYTDNQLIGYLKKNSFDIKPQLDYKRFKQKLKNASFIAVGESHGTQASYEVFNTMVGAISQVSNIDYYLVEFDYSSAYYLNEYLKSGEEKYLDTVFSHFDGTFFYNQSIAHSFKKIKENGALKNLRTIGVDIYHVPLIGFKHLSSILDNKNINKSSFSNFRDFMSLPYDSIRYRNAHFMRLLQSSIQELEANKGSLLKQWGDKFYEISYILKAIDISYQIKTADESKQDSLRDNQMFENFKILRHQLGVKQTDKLFFFGGREHVIKVELPNANKFVSLMNKHLYTGKTVSISMFYTNSLFMIPNEQFGIEDEGKYSEKNFFNDNGPFFEIDNINLLIDASGTSSVKGFDLHGKKSPFANKNIFTKEYSSPYPTNQFYDFIILINNSKATQPYGN